MPRFRALLTSVLLSTACAQAPNGADSAQVSDPLEGAWQRVGANTAQKLDSLYTTQPGFRLFVDGHYSQVTVNGPDPRPLLTQNSTDTERVAAWGEAFTAESGTYVLIDDESLIQRPIVVKDPGLMVPGAFITQHYLFVGDTLWMTQTANQDGPLPRIVGKYVRVQSGP